MIKKSILNELNKHSYNMRQNIIELGYQAGRNGSHQGPALSLVEIYNVLYNYILSDSDLNFANFNRSRVILSKGHGALALYTALYECGILSKSELFTYEKNGGAFPGQPSKNILKGIETSTGSLGIGMPYATGIALAYKRRNIDSKVYTIVGDGECNEGSIWEAVMFARHYKLDNLTVIVDRNNMQSDGISKEILDVNLKNAFLGFDWNVIESDGHSIEELINAFSNNISGKPKVIIANTIKGCGVSFMENSKDWHHNVITDELFVQAKKDLEKKSGE
ncbi:transketolase [Candidatus Izemoplasma sp. B36]|uniref:transketolase n=1 Tax=Candidatus Izemoplasma sp. B36 TaxID=3242468 RepID=UPI0035564C48